jgi:hypothetical protein
VQGSGHDSDCSSEMLYSLLTFRTHLIPLFVNLPNVRGQIDMQHLRAGWLGQLLVHNGLRELCCCQVLYITVRACSVCTHEVQTVLACFMRVKGRYVRHCLCCKHECHSALSAKRISVSLFFEYVM